MKNSFSIKKLAAAALIASTTAISLTAAAPAEAGVCSSTNTDRFVNRYTSVPNYNQSSYGGPNDCGPVAMAMQLKYLNDVTTPGVWRNGDPEAIIQLLYNALPYSRRYGTWDLSTLTATSDFWRNIKSVAASRTRNANNWGGDDDQLTWWSDLTEARRYNNPLDILILWPGTSLSGGGFDRDVERHWMTGIGTRYNLRKGNACKWGLCTPCWDYLAGDRRFSIVRTGWVEGGNAYSFINFDEGNWYTIEIFDRA